MAANSERFADLAGIVTTVGEIEAVVGTPVPQVLAKVVDRLDDVCRDFIARSPFCMIASTSPNGHIDLSPKGDPAGFVKVLDERRLAIPDRPGNRRTDTFRNLIEDPRLGIIFIIPGKTETLRVSGEARIVRDETIRGAMAVNGRVPELAIVVYVERAFMHCPKCMIRSKLWDSSAWPDASDLPTIGEAMIRHGKLSTTPDALLAFAEQQGLTTLY
jgi:PPOX class probable FMN-dependent enzyme